MENLKKKIGVVMLPTNKKASDKPFSIGITLCDDDKLRRGNLGNFESSRELYFTSNEEIKEGDWYILNLGENTRIVKVKSLNSGHSIYSVDIESGYAQLSDLRKIIATTDKSLKIEDDSNEDTDDAKWTRLPISLPEPSIEFIKAYIKAYNEGNPIKEVMVEYEFTKPYFKEVEGEDRSIEVYPVELKVNKNNQITITKVKDSWGREEVINKIKDFNQAIARNQVGIVDKWIEENL